jgi:hypothetical protein
MNRIYDMEKKYYNAFLESIDFLEAEGIVEAYNNYMAFTRKFPSMIWKEKDNVERIYRKLIVVNDGAKK